MTYRLFFSNLFIALAFAALAALAATPMSYAEPSGAATAEASTTQPQAIAQPTYRLKLFARSAGGGKFKTPTKRVKIKCNGKTTSQCCSGLSYCGCLYMPGSSDDNHPTSCHSNPPPKPGRG